MLFIFITSIGLYNLISILAVLFSKHNKINWNFFIFLTATFCLPAAFIYAYKTSISNIEKHKNLYGNIFTLSVLSYVVPILLMIVFTFTYNVFIKDEVLTSSKTVVFEYLYSVILSFMVITLIFNIKMLFSSKWTNSKVIYIIYLIQLFMILMMSITWGLGINDPESFLGILVWSDVVDSAQMGSLLLAGINVIVFSSYLWIWNIHQKETDEKTFSHSLFGSYGATVFLIILFTMLLGS